MVQQQPTAMLIQGQMQGPSAIHQQPLSATYSQPQPAPQQQQQIAQPILNVVDIQQQQQQLANYANASNQMQQQFLQNQQQQPQQQPLQQQIPLEQQLQQLLHSQPPAQIVQQPPLQADQHSHPPQQQLPNKAISQQTTSVSQEHTVVVTQSNLDAPTTSVELPQTTSASVDAEKQQKQQQCTGGRIQKPRRSNRSANERVPKLSVTSVDEGSVINCHMENKLKTITFKFDISDVNPVEIANKLVKIKIFILLSRYVLFGTPNV